MRRADRFGPAAGGLLLLLAAAPSALGQGSGDATGSPLDNRQVRTTILRGSQPPLAVPSRPVIVLGSGDISLNFPGVDIQAVAKAILGDTLHVPFTIDPNLHNQVTLLTPHPIRRQDVLPFFEQALLPTGLVLAEHGGSYAIMPSNLARAQAPAVGPNDPGFGNETIVLKFVNAEEMRKLLDPLVPGAISIADPTRNVLVVSGDSTQRKALRDLVAEFDVDWLKGMSFALLIPQRTDARLIAPELDKLLNSPGAQSAGLVRLIAMDRLNGILAITSQPQYLDDVRRFVEVLDREGESAERRVFVYHVQNGRAADLAKVLNSAFGRGGMGGAQTDTEATSLVDHTAPTAATAPLPPPPGAGFAYNGQVNPMTGRPNPAQTSLEGDSSAPRPMTGVGGGGGGTTVTADEANNAIVVFAIPRDYALISDALAKLDVPPLQVMIDASISEVTLNHNLQYGIQWAFQAGRLGGALSQGAQTSITNPTTGAVTIVNPGPQQDFPGLSFLYQGHGVSATLNALATITDVTVLSAPKLVVLNNHTATIEVGNQVPVSTGSATSTLTSGAPIVNSIEYRDTGIILKVTPRVNSGGLVLLDIAQEVSNVVPQVGSQTSVQLTSPTISQRKIATSVAVQDGETVALGGLMSNQVSKGRSTIPLLGNIPILGHLFGDTTGSLARTELVVLLTPRVVRAPVDARAVTQELRDKIHLAAPPPPPRRGP
ncbi:MAG: ral secretion pathway protein [Caulobacteraceae bacterium]|nr:ral secretion pathway protein [Caulobacteraceae bacterium]